ncbi:MAG: helix-turn-helix domain-containing protein [Candidatus Melainabacteria bacterium]|nr:helix-turn-helix domain-containing protein [Candidatus Melainabacteria bacterium]
MKEDQKTQIDVIVARHEGHVWIVKTRPPGAVMLYRSAFDKVSRSWSPIPIEKLRPLLDCIFDLKFLTEPSTFNKARCVKINVDNRKLSRGLPLDCYSYEEAANILGVSQSRLESWLDNRFLISGIAGGGKKYIPKWRLDQFVRGPFYREWAKRR